jgi:LAO/AO transport system kinase
MTCKLEKRDDIARELAARVAAGDRRALAKAITLVESTRSEDRRLSDELLIELMPKGSQSIRLGITGAPGVGKSTFIEAFGSYLTGQGRKVAVLAVDPSSARSGGSILGDKTRMNKLSRDANAFIRPSPSGGGLGGVARRTREAIFLVEAAGFDVVIVETVGVGQSEYVVASMVDMFLLLLAPGGGDDLQGIKRGIMELADLVIVNKADGDLLPAANHAASDYRSALTLIRPRYSDWTPSVVMVSALLEQGMDDIWTAVQGFRSVAEKEPDGLRGRRAEQARQWLWSEVEEHLMARFRADPAVAKLLESLEKDVAGNSITPSRAADELLRAFISAREQGGTAS